MAANELALTYTDIQKYVGTKVLWDRNPGSWTVDNDSDFAHGLKRGLRKVYFQAVLPGESQPHAWSFLTPEGTVYLWPDFTDTAAAINNNASTPQITIDYDSAGETYTGSGWFTDTSLYETRVSISFSTAELTETEVIKQIVGSTDLWPSANHLVDLSGDAWSATQIAASPVSAAVTAKSYILPDAYAGMASNSITLRRDQTVLGQIPIVNEQEIRRHDDDGTTGPPRMAAVVPIAATSSQSTRWGLEVFPRPDKAFVLTFRYNAVPPLMDESVDVYHWGGVPMAEVILAAVADETMKLVRDSNELSEDYQMALISAVKQDRRLHPKHTYGFGVKSMGTRYHGPRSLSDHYRYRRQYTPYDNITFLS